MRRFRALLVAAALVAPGCGGGASAPSATIAVVDGVTGSAVAGPAVMAQPGDTVSVERAGYLRRDTVVPRDGVISLWPLTVDEAYVRALVYSEPAVRSRLLRWTGTSVPISRDFPAEIPEAVRPWLELVPSDAPAITVTVDPGDPRWGEFTPDIVGFALNQLSDSDAHILSTRIVFRSEGALGQPGNLLHEVGHAIGLQHSARRGDLMFPSTARTTNTFSADERVLLTMMYAHRRPGQVAPDDDRALGQARSGSVARIFP